MKAIEGFPNYKITRNGKVYCIKRRLFKKEKPGGFKKYARVELFRDGVRYHKWVHRLVCEHFVGCCKDKHVHHKNGNYLDNRDTNLIPLTFTQHLAAHRKLREKERERQAREMKEGVPF